MEMQHSLNIGSGFEKMKEKKIWLYDFFDSDMEFVERKFMSYDEAVEYAIKTKALFQKNIVHDK